MGLPISDLAFVVVRPDGRELYIPPSAAALEILHRERPGEGNFKAATGKSLGALKRGLRAVEGSRILYHYREPRIKDPKVGGIMLEGEVRRAGAGGPGRDSFNHVVIRNYLTEKAGDVGIFSQVTVTGPRGEHVILADESLPGIEILDRHGYALLKYFYDVMHNSSGNPIEWCKAQGKIPGKSVFLPIHMPEDAAWRFVAERYCDRVPLEQTDRALLGAMWGNESLVNEDGTWQEGNRIAVHPMISDAIKRGAVQIKALPGGKVRYPKGADAFFAFDTRDNPFGSRQGLVYLGNDVYGHSFELPNGREAVFAYDEASGVPFFVELKDFGKSAGLVHPEQDVACGLPEKLAGGNRRGHLGSGGEHVFYRAENLRTGRRTEYQVLPPQKIPAFWEVCDRGQRDAIRAGYHELGIVLNEK